MSLPFYFNPFKCIDPCRPGVCAVNAYCSVINHIPNCKCNDGMIGRFLSKFFLHDLLINILMF